MIRQIIAGFLLLAFVNFLMGCSVTSPQKVMPEEARGSYNSISQIVLLDGTTITCKPVGAQYKLGQDWIRGKSLAHQPISVLFSKVKACRISPPRDVTLGGADTTPVAEVVLHNGMLVSFREPGARFDQRTGLLTGTGTGGRELSYAPAVVRSARTSVPKEISPAELMLRPQQPVYEIVDTSSRVTTFDSTAGFFEHQTEIFLGIDAQGKRFEVPVANVLYASVEKTDAAGTALATLGVIVGILGVLVIIVAATKQCCPFIYSYDGHQYAFDAEPLGGAICRGLGRTEISRLDHVRPVDGEYRLLVKNEVPETQYIDRMRLLVVDHPAGTRVFPDLQGSFYACSGVRGPVSAHDEKGLSLMKFLEASDNVFWQTDLTRASKAEDEPVRHTVTVTLPKPAGARKAWLVTNIGTSLWGSNMIRKTVEYRGNSAQPWLNSVTPGSQSFTELYQFLEREEMYHLKTWVKEGADWTPRALIQGQGPLISEDRVYPIDVSNVTGDSLVLRFDPPKGFWTFDYIGVTYDPPAMQTPAIVAAHRAEDQNTTSLVHALQSNDSTYYSMPEIGDRASIGFTVPQQQAGATRAVFLETSGYYELHLAKDKPEQLARLYFMWITPGQIVKETMREFLEWEAQQRLAQNQQQQHP